MIRGKSLVVDEKDLGVREECGVFGIISATEKELARDVYFGLFALQHRGQESAGIAVSIKDNSICYYKNMGLVNDVFSEKEMKEFPVTKTAIGHVRYSTFGSLNVINAQPIVFYGRHGRMALAFNGSIINSAKIKQKMTEAGHIFQSSTDGEIVAALINFYSHDGILKGIKRACAELVGAYAICLIAKDKLYAARDINGLKPLVLGRRGDDYIVASETCALESIDASAIRDIVSGEIVSIDLNGRLDSIIMPNVNKKSCVFEYVYLARTDSVMDNVSVYEARYESGKALASLYKLDADIVSGVPDSALIAARGYSDFSGIPYVDALSKNRYIGRTFIQPTQAMRESSVKIKLSAFRKNIEGKRLILIDDSIVRGTTCKKIIKMLRQNGVKEVHMLIASPMVKYPCFYGVDMSTSDQLLASHKSVDEICKEIGADSLHYIPLEHLKTACKDKNNEYCLACFNGEYPIVVEGE